MTNFTDRHGASHPLPAPEAEAQVRADDRGHVFHSWSAQDLIDPPGIVSALGSRFTDHTGREYLDFASQLVNVNLGHQHPDLVAAIQEQAGRLATIQPSMANATRGELASIPGVGAKKLEAWGDAFLEVIGRY